MATTSLHSPVRPVRPSQLADLRPGTPRRRLGIALWTIQALLAVIFVLSGGMKLAMPADLLEAQSTLPIPLLRFIGSCEVAGALGMILPGLLRIRPGLTLLAAAGMVVLMVCATILTPIFIGPDPLMVALPAGVGVLAAFVGYGRLRLAPLRGRS
jgi:DoxX-like family